MRQWIAIFVAAGVVAASIPFIRRHDGELTSLLNKAKVAVGAPPAGTEKAVDPPALSDIDLANIDDRREVALAPAHGKRSAELTLDTVLQRAALGLLRAGRVHEGAAVLTDVKTGKALVWASSNQGRARDLVVEATAPSASVFKVVTGAALVEAGAVLDEKHCYSGGEQEVSARDLEADPERDKYCTTLPMAMGRSLNTVFARLALKHIERPTLEAAAHRLGWGVLVPFDVPVAPSTLDLPQDELEYARAAAGFWHSTMSPFQGANLAQTIANRGEMIRSFIVERVVGEDGQPIYERPAGRQVIKRALDERTAQALTQMLEQTVRNGTSFKSFHDRSGRPYLADVRVAGKTGTLTKASPETLYTWFVGFAPAREPEVAIAVLVSTRGQWVVKASDVACSLLRIYFADQGAPGVRYPYGYHGPRRSPDKEKQPAPQPSGAAAASASAPAVEG
ncbi:MAG: penicillin-binding protein [Deltaproteobacteria bacterium]|nr:penicillin-binding protein [Deltaproteobacteria bacterium]